MAKETMKEKIARLEARNAELEELERKVFDENIRLQEKLNEIEQGNADTVPREEYNRLEQALHNEEVKVSALMESVEKLKKKNAEQENKLKELRAANNDTVKRSDYELVLKQLEEQKAKGSIHAGRKKDSHLDVYLLSCWAKEMTDNEIIGSSYDGFDGKKTVARASYFRRKKELYNKNK